MKIIYHIALLVLSFILLSSSCKKQIVQPVNELSLLPAATQTGAGTFGCLLNGVAFVPKKPDFLRNPIGLKKFGGENVLGGNILARQRGTKWKPGKNVGRGKDDTLFSLIDGRVKFEDKGRKGRFISVYPHTAEGTPQTAA